MFRTCTYPDDRRDTGACGRRAVSLYETPDDEQPRCRRHDSGEVARIAAESGYARASILDAGAILRLGARLMADAKASILGAIATAPSADGWADA